MNNINSEDIDLISVFTTAFENINEYNSGRAGNTTRYFRRPTISRPFIPDCDVLEKDNETIIVANLAGVNIDDLKIKYEGGNLIIFGDVKKPYNESEYTVKSNQVFFGKFSKTIKLDKRLTNKNNIKPKLENGLLVIKLLFSEEHSFDIEIE